MTDARKLSSIRWLRALVLSGLAACRSAASPEPLVRLTLLATADLHGALEQVDRTRDGARPLGGAGALLATLEHERALDPQGTLLLDAGDIYQGTALSNLTQGRAMVEFMNLADYDAAAIGNHEFDFGIGVLRSRIAESDFPLLAANIVERAGGARPEWARSHVVIERKGVRVAVIGLATPSTPTLTLPRNVAELEFLDPAPVAQALVDELVPGSADMAVLLCHIGARRNATGEPHGDLVELAETVRGEAAVIGGHTHQVVVGTVEGVPLLEPGSNGRQIGRVELVFDRRTGRVSGEASVLDVYADALAPHPQAEAIVASHRAAIAPVLDEILCEAEEELGAARAECAMGNLLCDVMRAASGAHFAFQNPGGVRAPLGPGPVHYADAYRAMPFDNRIVVLDLSGAEVEQLLEQAAMDGSFLHVAGLRYAIDLARPPGARLVRVEEEDGSPLFGDALYSVAVNDFMAQGGDSLPVITDRPDSRDTGMLVRDALVERLRAVGRSAARLRGAVEGRIEIRR